MPGSNYLGSAYSTLSQLLGTPVAGPYSAGFDQLASGYKGAEEGGLADISRRGLTQSGAVPELYTKLGEDYAKGAGSIVSAGQQAQNAQTQQILDALLGLGGPAASRARADIGQEMTDIGSGADVVAGLIGDAPRTLFSQGGRGLFSSALFGKGGNLGQLFSRMIGI